AIGDVPGAERGGIVLAGLRLAATQALARLARPLGLERPVCLLGSGLATDGQAAVRLPAAAPAPILADMGEAAPLAPLAGRAGAADVAGAAATADMDRRLRRLALADHRLQGQRGRRAVLQPDLPAQGLDAFDREFLCLPAQQRLRQLHAAVAHALEPADLAALRFPE